MPGGHDAVLNVKISSISGLSDCQQKNSIYPPNQQIELLLDNCSAGNDGRNMSLQGYAINEDEGSHCNSSMQKANAVFGM
jgi:hypothetical protein